MSLSIDKNQSPEIDVRGWSSLKKRKEKEETLFNQTYMHALPIHIDWYDILKKKKKCGLVNSYFKFIPMKCYI